MVAIMSVGMSLNAFAKTIVRLLLFYQFQIGWRSLSRTRMFKFFVEKLIVY